MKTKIATAALLAATVSTGLLAQSPIVPRENRTDLRPEQTINYPVRVVKNDLSRKDVSAAYIFSRKETAAMTGEDSGSVYLAKQSGGSTALIVHR